MSLTEICLIIIAFCNLVLMLFYLKNEYQDYRMSKEIENQIIKKFEIKKEDKEGDDDEESR